MGSVKRMLPAVVMFCAFLAVLFSVFGGGSYQRRNELRQMVEQQQIENRELQQKVNTLTQEVDLLQTDDRELERTARNEMGLARSDELIFIFEDDTDAKPRP